MTKKSCLIVDDDATILKILIKILKNHYEVFSTLDGLKALEIYKNNKVDIIFSDYNMPKMNGVQLVQEIRKIDSHVPIAICTGFMTEDLVKEFESQKVTEVLPKPIRADKIIAFCKKALNDVLEDENE